MKSGPSHLLKISKHRRYSHLKSGFTIVELLVVIIVIGILAAITIVAYRGISSKAVISSLASDLTHASQQLKLFQVENSSYPLTINCALPDSSTNKCVKVSPSNNYSEFNVDNSTTPQSMCVSFIGSNGLSYRVTEDSTPVLGNCSRQSCYSILNVGESIGSGIYWIKPSGSATSFRVYCDMVTSGGGWTLVLTNPGPYTVWNMTTIYSLNSNSPSISSPYSILNKADLIKANIGGNLQYRIDSVALGHWGGVWQAPFSNTFVGTSIISNATNIEQYDIWVLDVTPADTIALTNIMPWIGNGTQLLSTWGNAGQWWGTLVTGTPGWNPAPYMSAEKPGPGIIWYWVK